MKKNFIIALTAIIVFASSTGFAFANTDTANTGDTTKEAAGTVVPDMNFTGPEIKLSLDKAIETVQTTGPGFELAQLNKSFMEAGAAGQSEALSVLKGSKTLDETTTKMARDHFRAQAPANYQAEMNKLEFDVVKEYYGVLSAQENLRISKDNLAVQKDILTNTQKKFKLGTVARMDVLSAESSVVEAELAVSNAETALKTAKMNFNIQLGNPIMQQVTLTDTFKQSTAPAINLVDSINSALGKRNEIKQAKYDEAVAATELNSFQYRYPKNSATYMNKEAAHIAAAKALKDIKAMIELEIRSSYMSLDNGLKQITAAKSTLENAKEAYRLAVISYDAGMRTLTDVQNAQIGVYQAELALSGKITEYNLNVYSFKFATDVGVKAAK